MRRGDSGRRRDDPPRPRRRARAQRAVPPRTRQSAGRRRRPGRRGVDGRPRADGAAGRRDAAAGAAHPARRPGPARVGRGRRGAGRHLQHRRAALVLARRSAPRVEARVGHGICRWRADAPAGSGIWDCIVQLTHSYRYRPRAASAGWRAPSTRATPTACSRRWPAAAASRLVEPAPDGGLGPALEAPCATGFAPYFAAARPARAPARARALPRAVRASAWAVRRRDRQRADRTAARRRRSHPARRDVLRRAADPDHAQRLPAAALQRRRRHDRRRSRATGRPRRRLPRPRRRARGASRRRACRRTRPSSR